MGTASVHIRRLAAAVILAALVAAALAAHPSTSAAGMSAGGLSAGDAVPDQLVVGFDEDTSPSLQRRTITRAGATIDERMDSIDGAVVATKPGRSTEQVADLLSRAEVVDFVEPNFVLKSSRLPNDLLLHQMWGIRNTGQLGGKAGADINAPGAWDVTTGGDVIVAVLDTGIDYRHLDLRNNMWANPLDPANGQDDDKNGFIDDVRGIDLAHDDADPDDDSSHGTHVAGIIGAEGNNALGTVGVDWRVRLMALKFLDDEGSGNTADAAQAIDYAVKAGARVVNASWGGPAYSTALYKAIKNAAARGVLVVAAAGNEGENSDASPEYPAAYDLPNVVSVAATDSTDELADFSNYGARSVDLAAPGDEIYSTVPPSASAGGYANYSGTSMAAPFVSGAAALYLSRTPTAGYVQVRDALLQSVDQLPTLAGKMVSGGRLNIARAFGLDRQVDTPPSAPTSDNTAPTPFALISPRNRYVAHKRGVRFKWQRAHDSSGIRLYRLYVDGKKRKTIKDPDGRGGRKPGTKAWYKVGSGRHRWFVRAYDYAGNSRKSKRSRKAGRRSSRVLFVGPRG